MRDHTLQTLRFNQMPIHSTAIINPSACIAETAEIGPYCVISGQVSIGPRTRVGPYVQVLGHSRIGADCQIHAGAVIGDVPQDRSYSGGVSFCDIGDRTVIREHVTIHRGTGVETATRVGNDCMLMTGSHVAHNCEVGNRVTLVSGALLGGYVRVEDNAVIAGNAGVHQFVRIGAFAMVGALTMVRQDVPPCFLIDERGLCVGINRVGLQRAGLGQADRDEAKTAYRLLCRSASTLEDAIESLRSSVRTITGRTILNFVCSESKRGLLRRSPKNSSL